jgi:uncharacterized protein YndB with AHSA1/START domain
MATSVDSLPPIVLTIQTPATPEAAWAALTEPDRIADWFTDASPLGGIGDAYRLDFGEGSVVEGVVRRVEPGRTFAYTWVWADVEPVQETLVTWAVEAADEGSRITLTHEGWADAGLDEAARDDHEAYWSGYLDDLADILGEVE